MTRTGRGSYGDSEDVQIECQITKMYPSGIRIWNGKKEPHPITKKKVPVTVFIAASQIDGGDFDVDKFAAGDRITITIPNWLALKEGLI